MKFQNYSDHPNFKTILDRLAPYATLLDRLCSQRNIVALVAVGSIPSGYARPESDLDLLAFVVLPGKPERTHYLEGKKIYLRELSIAQSRKELETCADVSLLPMALGILPFAVIYVHPGHVDRFWNNLSELQTQAVAFILHKVAGEICFGRRDSAVNNQSILVNMTHIAGYHLMFSALFNAQFSKKLPRLCANFIPGEEMILRDKVLPEGWVVTSAGMCFQGNARGNVITYNHFVWDVMKASWHWYHPSGRIRQLTFRQSWRHSFLGAKQISEPLRMHSTPLHHLPHLLMLTRRAAQRPDVRQQYGSLYFSPRGWEYSGLGSLVPFRRTT